MFGKLKNILGIEGVKLSIVAPAVVEKRYGLVKGKIQLESLSDQTVSNIRLKLIEKYARGRKDNRLIDEYVLGEVVLSEPIDIKKDETKTIPFELTYKMLNSEMDDMESSNIFSKGLVKMAKYLKNVNSTFRLEGAASVSGTKLSPTSSQVILIK